MQYLATVAVALFLTIGIFAARDGMAFKEGRLLFLLSLCLAALSLTTLPGLRTTQPEVYFVARALAVPNIGLFWLFCRTLLLDDHRFDGASALWVLVLSIAPAFYLLSDLDVPVPGHRLVESLGTIAPFAMMGHLAWITVSGRRDDLVATRRSARSWLLTLILYAALISLVAEYLPAPDIAMPITFLFAVVPAQIGLLLWLLRLQPEALRFAPVVGSRETAGGVDPRDRLLHDRLIALLEAEDVYAHPNLTIDTLATRLEVPAHRLRKMINQGLGFRNFPAFINGYRIRAAKRMLADPHRSRTAIISIAFESGFSSLQSFNRVFKLSVGVTPSEFRKSALHDTTQD